MAALLEKSGRSIPSSSFASGANHYGDAIASIKQDDKRLWQQKSPNLVSQAVNNATSTARRTFLELRSIREAAIPFISASPVGDSLDKILAAVEGPPDTPYEGGIFWVRVRIPMATAPPLLRFQTRIYHPNINYVGKICADIEAWWTDPRLSRFMGDLPLCDLLAHPNINDPLVPEIAQVYITDHKRFCEAASEYTQLYARHPRPRDEDVVLGDVNGLDEAGDIETAMLRLMGASSRTSRAASILSRDMSTAFSSIDITRGGAVHIFNDQERGERNIMPRSNILDPLHDFGRETLGLFYHVPSLNESSNVPNIRVHFAFDGSEVVLDANPLWQSHDTGPVVHPHRSRSSFCRDGNYLLGKVTFDSVRRPPRIATSVYEFEVGPAALYDGVDSERYQNRMGRHASFVGKAAGCLQSFIQSWP
ncbi:ubiquitin-conjugating enzyme/RWD-like protein [Podospora didyma]|uniref:Ubiquitin-conjugating enzyme/RWD-like protein n=1 Tax=Podospora didyma TaxID=330526 RepID=A0AAE0P514_9PEZI|nr:ubiquitin-conjugating enzyme/RWD-like protein [Podospora didyma]